MNGDSERPPESQEPIEGAELCPKCLSLVFLKEGVYRHCGERVFPEADSPPPSAEVNDASRRKFLIISFWCWMFLATHHLYGFVSNAANGVASSWMDWLTCILYTLMVLWWLSIWQKESQRDDQS